jgi:hypothetical protein
LRTSLRTHALTVIVDVDDNLFLSCPANRSEVESDGDALSKRIPGIAESLTDNFAAVLEILGYF